MLNQKTIARHERNNADATAEILRNRTSWPLVMSPLGRSLPAPPARRTSELPRDE